MSSAKKTKYHNPLQPKAEVNVHQFLDPYRTVPNSFKKPILEFSAANPFPEELPTPATPVLLHIKSQHHTSRLANKNLILTDPPLTGPALEEGKRKREAIQKGNRKRALASKSELERWEKEKEVGEKRKRTGLSDRKSSRKIWGLQAGSSIQYNLLIPLHYLYLSYLSELLSLPSYRPSPIAAVASGSSPQIKLPNGSNCDTLSARIVKSDLTGAKLRVKRAKNDNLTGIEGIVIQETAGTFKLVGKDDLIRVIPKANSLFLLSFPAYHFSSLPNAPQSDPEVSSIPPLPPIDPSDPLSFLSSPDPEPSLARSQYEAFEQTLKEVAKIEIDILGSAFAFRSSDRVGRKFKFGGVLDQGWSEEWLLPEVLGDI